MNLLDRITAEVEGRDPGNLCQPLRLLRPGQSEDGLANGLATTENRLLNGHTDHFGVWDPHR